MARFVKKLGTQQLRYQFDLTIFQIKMSVPYTVSVQLVWKKDQKRVETKSNPVIGGKSKDGSKVEIGDFQGEVISLISSLYRDKNATNKFTEKMSALVIKIAKGEKSKSVG